MYKGIDLSNYSRITRVTQSFGYRATFNTMSIIYLCIAAYVFACVQIEVHTFSSTQNCIDEIVKLVKERRSDLSTEYLQSNWQTNDSLRWMCQYYVTHKVHKVLNLVDKDFCDTEIPTSSELDEKIYEAYIELLNQLKIYEGREVANSFGWFNDHVTLRTVAVFDQVLDRLAGICLHIGRERIE